jgi:hypothetical protein
MKAKTIIWSALPLAAWAAHALDISGKVLTKAFGPIAGAKVCAQAEPDKCATSAADGTFRLQGAVSVRPHERLAQAYTLEYRRGAFALNAPEAARARLEWFSAGGRSLAAREASLAAGRNALEAPAHDGQGLLILRVTTEKFSLSWKTVLGAGAGSSSTPGAGQAGAAAFAAVAKTAAPSALVATADGYANGGYQPAAETETGVLIVLGGAGENVKLLFDGKTFNGWDQNSGKTIGGATGSWEIKDDALSAKGTTRGTLTPKDDYASFRLFFTLRHVHDASMGGDHTPCIVIWGMPRDALPNDALGGVQFQPPNAGHWDYRPGKNNGGGSAFTSLGGAGLNSKDWNQCELYADATTSTAKLACCKAEEGKPCKGLPKLQWKESGWAKKSPWGFQIHNKGLKDQFKNVSIEVDPVVKDLISPKF